MRLAWHITANVVSQAYVALLGILLLPVYLHFLGGEAFGLVALSFTLQAWVVILDFGWSPTLTRAAATYRAGKTTPDELCGLLRSTLWIYLAVGIAAMTVLSVAAVMFSGRWFRHELLSADELLQALLVMGGVIALRWLADLLRSIHFGFERFVWLSKFNASMATLRFVLIVPLLAWTNAGIIGFFVFQLLIGLLECGLLAHQTRRVMPKESVTVRVKMFHSLRKFRHFALTMALVGACWVLVSQTDKVLLSGLMTLAEFGEFTLATTAAGAVLLATTPLSAVILSRMTALLAKNDYKAFQRMYSYSTQWLGLIAWPLAAMLSLHAERILFVWTGDSLLATSATPVLRLYAMGNGVLAVSAVAYVGQFARGELRLHVLGSAVFLLLLLPLILWSTSHFGAIGAGWVWLLLNLAYMLIWLVLTHRTHGPYPYSRWLCHDVLPLGLLAFATAALGGLLPWPEQRIWLMGQLALLGLLTQAVTVLGASWARETLRLRWVYGRTSDESSGEAEASPARGHKQHG
jgi:O-antigen/teichoic acid export membrane protein